MFSDSSVRILCETLEPLFDTGIAEEVQGNSTYFFYLENRINYSGIQSRRDAEDAKTQRGNLGFPSLYVVLIHPPRSWNRDVCAFCSNILSYIPNNMVFTHHASKFSSLVISRVLPHFKLSV